MADFKSMILYVFVLTFYFCNTNKSEWESEWQKHNKDFKSVVELLKADKLKLTMGRSGYAIPDSIDLNYPYGQMAYRETDFSYDGSYSVLFYLDTINSRSHHAIVFTDNQQRIGQYDNMTSVIKIEENWYYKK